MRGPNFLPRNSNFADLDNQRKYLPNQASLDSGNFYSTRAKYLIVTAGLWSGLLALATLSWVGAFRLGALFARWIGH